MPNKSERRRAARLKKRAAKESRMTKSGAKSKYAFKRAQQLRGNYRPTSPFYLSAAQIEYALACLDRGQALPAYAVLGH